MTNFYTWSSVHMGKILYRGYENGMRVSRRIQYAPAVYIPTQETDTPYKSLHGIPLAQKTFASIAEARHFFKEMENVSNTTLHGHSRFDYAYLAENFRGELQVPISDLSVNTIDIETATEAGFPNVREANEEILLITCQDYNSKKVVTFGSRPSTAKNYILCNDEAHLLRTFIAYIKLQDPDIITGWNVNYFDVTYTCNRIKRILSEDKLNELSPFGIVTCKDVTIMDRVEQEYSIVGRSVLDLLDLYKKFRFKSQPSYKLDYVAEDEIGERKLENPGESFKDFYTNHWDTFVAYNQRDVTLVTRMEEKLGLVYLAIMLAHLTKCNFEDVFSPVKTWENYIMSVLLEENTFVEFKGGPGRSEESIEGGYVREPVPGLYKWAVCFDATSLYPMIMWLLNMSPETIVGMLDAGTVEDMLSGKFPDEHFSRNYALAANGAMFSKEKIGIMPRLVQLLFQKRKDAKKKMLAAKSEYEKSKDPAAKREADLQGVVQLALKVNLNSLFGATSNEYFMFFDNRIAEGITKTGQLAQRWVSQDVDKYLMKVMNSKKSVAIYGDTDSIYFTFDKMVQDHFAGASEQKICTMLDKFIETKMRPVLKSSTDTLSDKLNTFARTLEFKREAIASSGIWLAKKRYALRVIDMEGVRYAEPEIKITGIETQRSSTPDLVRAWLTEAITVALEKMEVDPVRDYVNRRHKEFMSYPVEDIAFPRSANNLSTYSSQSEALYVKGTPLQVRATLKYNALLKEKDLTKKYALVREGEKIKYTYLKTPNTIQHDVIAFQSVLPKEFDLHSYVDYETQWSKAFLEPLDKITSAAGWSLEEKASLEDFFC